MDRDHAKNRQPLVHFFGRWPDDAQALVRRAAEEIETTGNHPPMMVWRTPWVCSLLYVDERAIFVANWHARPTEVIRAPSVEELVVQMRDAARAFDRKTPEP